MSEYVKPDKPYAEWTQAERTAAIEEGKRKSAILRAQREAEAAARNPIKPNPAPAVEQMASQVVEAALPSEVLGDAAGPAPDEDAAVERRRRLLGDLSPDEAAMFTDAELEKIDREETEKASSERKARALKDVRAISRMHAQVSHDLLPASMLRDDDLARYMNEEVEFTIAVPLGGAGRHRLTQQIGIRVNSFLYQYGAKYRRPRHIYNSLLETMYRAYYNEAQFRTLDQGEPGNSAKEVTARTLPPGVVATVVPHAA